MTKSATVTPITSARAPKGKAAPSVVVPDAKLADDRHAKDRAAILQAIDTAEDLLGTALVAALQMTARFGRTSKDEVRANWPRCNNPDVYASWFNLGAKAQAIVGEKLALQAIESATAKGTGSAFQRAREALSGIVRGANAQGVKTLDGRKAQALMKEAVGFATEKSAERKAAKPKGAQGQRTATMGAAAIESGKGRRELAAAVKLCSQSGSRMEAPEGRESAWHEAMAALQVAAEKLALFAK